SDDAGAAGEGGDSDRPATARSKSKEAIHDLRKLRIVTYHFRVCTRISVRSPAFLAVFLPGTTAKEQGVSELQERAVEKAEDKDKVSGQGQCVSPTD